MPVLAARGVMEEHSSVVGWQYQWQELGGLLAGAAAAYLQLLQGLPVARPFSVLCRRGVECDSARQLAKSLCGSAMLPASLSSFFAKCCKLLL
jgi:hypothetical protein